MKFEIFTCTNALKQNKTKQKWSNFLVVLTGIQIEIKMPTNLILFDVIYIFLHPMLKAKKCFFLVFKSFFSFN